MFVCIAMSVRDLIIVYGENDNVILLEIVQPGGFVLPGIEVKEE